MDNQAKPTHIIGIGASAGGLEAVEQFFSKVTPDERLAYVLVQHLSPNHKSLMPELLTPITPLNVIEATDGCEVAGDTNYLIPPQMNLTIGNGLIHLAQQQRQQNVNFPIDIFFESLSYEMQQNSIGIILSGTGSDGKEGIIKIKEYDGYVMAQDPQTADFAGMPESAIATGLVNKILAPEDMPSAIQDHIRKNFNLKSGSEVDLTILHEENAISLIFALLKRKYDIDFGDYKLATMLRRIERRVHLSESENIAAYLGVLREDSEEVEVLYRELLVEVTHFFRDQEAFKIISSKIIPELFEQTDPTSSIRVWVPGCATGEEAYSLAILIHEYMSLHQISREVKIFATDVHQRSLDYGSRGVFSEEKLASVPPIYIDRYFSYKHGSYTISPEIRRLVIFAKHNLIQDPPFTRINLITCRNVLIYFRPFVQKRVLEYVNFGLLKDGILFLGPSENTNDLNDEFVTLSHRWRIFKKKYERKYSAKDSINLDQNKTFYYQEILQEEKKQAGTLSRRSVRLSEWEKALMGHFVPTGFFVDENFNALHIFGDAGKFLGPSEGIVSTNLFSMVHKSLQPSIRAALHRAGQSGEPVSYGGIQIEELDNQEKPYRIIVDPIFGQDVEQVHYFVRILVDQSTQDNPPQAVAELTYSAEELDHIESLERELSFAKENLQHIVEELETTNEELQTTNEELMASNEELQSTNEELHSVNEELYTVNSEYQLKINELTKLNNDMKNLQRSSKVRILFLDQFLRIRDFTPEMAETFNLLPHDVGRPIEHLLYNLNLGRDELAAYVQHVLQNKEAVNREVETPKQERFLLQILPYQLETGDMEGVVLYMTDISGLKTMEGEMLKNQKRFQTLLQNIRRPVIYHDADGKIIHLNTVLAGMLERDVSELIGVSLEELSSNGTDLAPYLEAVEENRPTPRITLKLRARNDKMIDMMIDSQPIFDSVGNLIEYQGIGNIVA